MVEIQRSLGALYLDRGQAVEAEAVLRSGLALALELNGPAHPSTLAVRRQLGLAYLQLGRLAEAEQALRAQHGPTEAALGPWHRETGLSLDALGRLALERGDTAAAITTFEQAVAVGRQPDGRYGLDYALADLAQALQAKGDREAARARFEEARRVRVARFGASHPAVGDLDRMMGELLLESGDVAAALPWLERADQLTRLGYGPEDPRSLRAQLALARAQAGSGEGESGADRLARFAAALPADAALAPLRWEAQAYAAQALCHDQDVAGGRRMLGALDAELLAARPEGGRLSREVAGLAATCSVRLNGPTAATAAR
ncbi:tetratricopeptide repeat protein [Pseudoxanthomonas daejeonensis]|nr:tetratricopeptide repeat protein [Pseudoxanthomonas daejeonensis]